MFIFSEQNVTMLRTIAGSEWAESGRLASTQAGMEIRGCVNLLGLS